MSLIRDQETDPGVGPEGINVPAPGFRLKIRRIVLCTGTALTLGVFAAYWLTTLVYVSPNNPLRIFCEPLLSRFNDVAYQAWNFFAPPPNSDDRVYFSFVPNNPDSPTLHFEILSNLYARKRAKSPFNTEEQVLDYILSGAAGGVNDAIRENKGYLESASALVKAGGDKSVLTELETRLNALFDPAHCDDPSVCTLRNYVAIIAAENSIDPASYRASILITSVDLPKYKDRARLMDKARVAEEVIRYKSELFPINFKRGLPAESPAAQVANSSATPAR